MTALCGCVIAIICCISLLVYVCMYKILRALCLFVTPQHLIAAIADHRFEHIT